MATAVRYNGPHTQVTVRGSDGVLYTCGRAQQITVPDDTAAALFAEGWTAPDGSTPGYTPPISHVIEDVFLDNGVLSKQTSGGPTPVPVGSTALARTVVKTANYTAAAGDLVACDPTGGAFTVTLPSAPADKAQVEVKIITATAPNAVTIATAGSDVLNRAGGATSTTLQVPGHSNTFQYDAATGIWTITQSDTPLAQLDTRYRVPSVYAQGNRVAMLGDSITTGLVETPGSSFGWGAAAPLPQAHFLSDGKLLMWGAYGVTGETTGQFISRTGTFGIASLIASKPDWAIVLGGTNDAGQGVSLATFSANIQTIVATFRAAGIRPVLCTVPPQPTGLVSVGGVSTQRQALADTYNKWLRYYAHRNGLPLVDCVAVLMDPATGLYLSAYDNGDHIHPNSLGATVVGQAIVDTIGPLLNPWAPPLPTFQANDSNLLANGLFLNDVVSAGQTAGDGVPDGWAKTGSATVSIVSGDSTILGNWLRIQDAVAEFSQVATSAGNIAAGASTFAVGDRIAFCGRFKNDSNVAGGISVFLTFNGSTGPVKVTPVSNWKGTLASHKFYVEYTVPAGTTSISVTFAANGGAAMDARIAQIGVYNLTKLGATG